MWQQSWVGFGVNLQRFMTLNRPAGDRKNDSSSSSSQLYLCCPSKSFTLLPMLFISLLDGSSSVSFGKIEFLVVAGYSLSSSSLKRHTNAARGLCQFCLIASRQDLSVWLVYHYPSNPNFSIKIEMPTCCFV